MSLNMDTAILNRTQHFINGSFSAASGQGRLELINPYTEKVFGSVALGTVTDVNAAVQAARSALPSWSALSRQQRAEWIGKLAGALKTRIETIAQIETACMGSPIAFSRLAQAQVPVMLTASHVELLMKGAHDELIGNSRVVREPIGVVGAIAAWNYPLLLLLGKVIPAITAGCTVVAKPSEITPLSALLVADALAEIDFPAGVINIVNGTGAQVGEALVSHPDIDMVTFTGSTTTGKRVMAQAAATVKKVALELGGKSATVVLDDAPLEQAVRAAVSGCMMNGAQTCIALSRLIVPKAKYAQALEIAVDETRKKFVCGDPTLDDTTMGPMAFAAHRERVRSYIAIGLAEGASLLTGGAEQPEGQAHGYFVQPTVFGNVLPHMRIAQEEIFGPVLSVLGFEDEDEAVAIANGTIYGLNGAVWSADPAHAVRVARKLQCGKVDINGGGWNLNAPAGGFKQSGIGRERGPYAVEEFLQVKALQFNNDELAQASDIGF